MNKHSSGSVISMEDRRWICICGVIFPDDKAWLAHSKAHKRDPDPPGTCHLVGCPRKGQHAPHVFIGAGTWADYNVAPEPKHCLGFPAVGVDISSLDATCSIAGVQAWWVHPMRDVTPEVMAELVDQHRRECTNRQPR